MQITRAYPILFPFTFFVVPLTDAHDPLSHSSHAEPQIPKLDKATTKGDLGTEIITIPW